MGMTVKYVMDRVNTLQELDDKLNTAPKNVNTREELAKAVGENLTYDDILELTALVRSSIADYLNMEVKNVDQT